MLVAPHELDLLQVHLDDLAEVNQQLLHSSQHHLTLASQVDLLDRTIIVRRPYIEYTLEDLYETVSKSGNRRLRMDGRLLDTWEVSWIVHQLRLAVQRLHDAGLFHGSLHPANVLIDSSLRVVLVDLSPYKPYGLSADDPTVRMLFYKDSQIPFIDPRRFEATHGDITQRQMADVYALDVIVASIKPPGVILADFKPVVNSVLLPIVRQIGDSLDIGKLESILEDLCLLVEDNQEVARILCRYMISHLFKLDSESKVLRLLRCISRLRSKTQSNDVEFYLKALSDLKISKAISIACTDQYINYNAEADNVWSIDQLLRYMTTTTWTRDDIDLLVAFAMHPDGTIRRLAFDYLHELIQSMDEVTRVALVLSKLQPLLRFRGAFDIGKLSRETLPYVFTSPFDENLFALILRNQDRIPELLRSFADEEAKRLEASEPLFALLGQNRSLKVLDRREIGVNPRSWPLATDHEAFSPLLSPLDDEEESMERIPIMVEPSVYRHFQQRRMPFMFNEYTRVNSCGEYFAALTKTQLRIWRSRDFRTESIPEPWMSIPCAESTVFCLAKADAYLCEAQRLTGYDLTRKNLTFEVNLHVAPIQMVPFQHLLLLVLPRSLALFDCVKRTITCTSEICNSVDGAIAHVVVSSDGLYAVTSSFSGYLGLWDLRFGLRLRSWRLPSGIVCGLSFITTKDPSSSPPSLWILVEQDSRPVVSIIDFGSASIVASTAQETIGEPLLDGLLGNLELSPILPTCSFVHPPGAHWILFSDPNGHLMTCSARQSQLDIVPIETTFQPTPLKSLHIADPTSIESSRSLSVLQLTTSGSLSILELLK